MIFVAMILLGSVIGFVGAGGAGVTITLLTVGFGVPVHTALAVALAAMTFTMISGTVSHYREHEVDVKPDRRQRYDRFDCRRQCIQHHAV